MRRKRKIEAGKLNHQELYRLYCIYATFYLYDRGPCSEPTKAGNFELRSEEEQEIDERLISKGLAEIGCFHKWNGDYYHRDAMTTQAGLRILGSLSPKTRSFLALKMMLYKQLWERQVLLALEITKLTLEELPMYLVSEDPIVRLVEFLVNDNRSVRELVTKVYCHIKDVLEANKE